VKTNHDSDLYNKKKGAETNSLDLRKKKKNYTTKKIVGGLIGAFSGKKSSLSGKLQLGTTNQASSRWSLTEGRERMKPS